MLSGLIVCPFFLFYTLLFCPPECYNIITKKLNLEVYVIMKKFLSILIAISLIISILPAAFANGEEAACITSSSAKNGDMVTLNIRGRCSLSSMKREHGLSLKTMANMTHRHIPHTAFTTLFRLKRMLTTFQNMTISSSSAGTQ